MIRLIILSIFGLVLVSKKILVVLYPLLILGLDSIFIPIPVIKNFLLSNDINSCSRPQIFLPFTNISFGNFKFTSSLVQKCLITLEIITALMIENSSNEG